MAGLQNDTSELRAWLASQLKLEDVPEEIWDILLKKQYVEEAQDPDLPDGRPSLLEEARELLRVYRAGSVAPKMSKKQRTGRRQRATATSRSEAEAEIVAKIDKAKAARSKDTLSNPLGTVTVLEAPGPSFADSPLLGKISNNRITVTAEPWVSPEAVRRQYESLRDSWFWSSTPSERRVELLRFVTGFCEGYYDKERGIAGLKRSASWRQMMDNWNERYPQDHDWHYTDVRNFRRDFGETFEALTLFKDF